MIFRMGDSPTAQHILHDIQAMNGRAVAMNSTLTDNLDRLADTRDAFDLFTLRATATGQARWCETEWSKIEPSALKFANALPADEREDAVLLSSLIKAREPSPIDEDKLFCSQHSVEVEAEAASSSATALQQPKWQAKRRPKWRQLKEPEQTEEAPPAKKTKRKKKM
jgi:hypothetical protein